MAGALDKMAAARGQRGRKEFDAKGRNITWAIFIVNSLDVNTGGEIAANLTNLS